MKKSVTVFGMFIVLALATPGLAGDCQRLWTYVDEATHGIITSFKEYDPSALERNMEDLLFWDSYLQIECGGGVVAESPIYWLGEKYRGKTMTPYTAGFVLWLKELKEENLDISPSGLVRGRKFTQ